MAVIRLQLVIPFHQPVSATREDLGRATDLCYAPLLEGLEGQPDVRVALHLSGHLIDYLARERSDFLMRIKRLVKSGQAQLLGGLFYGGAPALLPELDTRGQVEMMMEFCESIIGEAPRGFWLTDLAWCAELPRLFAETGLEYGFLSSSQVEADSPPPLGVLERTGVGLGGFVLDAELSAALPFSEPEDWLERLAARAASGGDRLVNAWVRAESLGIEPSGSVSYLREGWTARWLTALAERRPDLETVLPQQSWVAERPAAHLQLRDIVAPELMPLAARSGPTRWADFPASFSEADRLYRRMLRASAKLREAIVAMEEDGLDDDWSDKLATAQRHVFSAQTTDVYWRGPTPGFTDPRLRDAAFDHLAVAESMVDALVQDEDDWISTEEEDRDGDLAEEVFVSNRHVNAWIVPAAGGSVRSFEDRAARLAVLDAGARRAEPFFAEMEQAPVGPAVSEPRVSRGEGLRRLTEELPVARDGVEWLGIREWLLEPDTLAGELFTGELARHAAPRPVEILRNEIDEQGDATYRFVARSRLGLEGVRPRTATVEKEISIPVDAPELKLAYEVHLEGEGRAILAVEIPLRLGAEPAQLLVDGNVVPRREGEYPEVSLLRLQSPAGRKLELALDPALDVWVLPVRTILRDLAGYRAVDQGTIVVPLIRLEPSATATLVLRLGGPE